MLRAADVFVDAGVPIEAAPSKHGVAQGFFLYVEPGGNRIEVTTGGYFVYDPDFEPITWTAGSGRAASLGREDDRELPHVRHARRRRGGDPLTAYDPQVQQMLVSIAELGAPPLTELTPQGGRREEPAFFREMVGPGPELTRVRDIAIRGPAGPIPARIYEPAPNPVGTVVYYHGGGWCPRMSRRLRRGLPAHSPSRRERA